MKLTAFLYDRYGAFTGSEEVLPAPMADGRVMYMLPKWSTLIEPPRVGRGQAAVFLESTQTWLTVSDHRNEYWFDWKGEPILILRLGNPAEWGLQPYRVEAAQ